MRRLVLFRHAKSDWATDGLQDHERSLAERGAAAAPQMARWLAEQKILPEVILCSTATRTRQTLDLALGEWTHKPHVHFDKALYLSSPDRIRALIREHGHDAGTLMVVGHNPDMLELTLDCVAVSIEPEATVQIGKFPTAGMAVLSLDIGDWSDLTKRQGTLEAFMKPKDVA